jgi:hypothetical protein
LRDGLPERLLAGRARFSQVIDEAQKRLPSPALHLDPTTRTVTAGDEDFVLGPAQFAFYWMMVEKCLAAQDGVYRNDPGLGLELLGFYRCLVDDHSAAYEQAEKAYQNFNEENFDPVKTKVNGRLKRVLGVRRATPYLIGKIGTHPAIRPSKFGLSLPPAAITIETASLPTRRARAAGTT